MKKILIILITCFGGYSFILAQNNQQNADDLALKYANSLNLSENYILLSFGFKNANSTINTIIPSQVYTCPNYNSYFYFININPFSNNLRGYYMFVNYDDGSIESIEKDYPPYDCSSANPLTFINTANLGPPQQYNFSSGNNIGGDPDHNYAVIISGGANDFNNWERYWNDCQAMYSVLRNVYNYKPENIYCLVSDGTDPSKDRHHYDYSYDSSPLDFDGDGSADIAYPATIQSITSVFNLLGNSLTEDDFLFIFTTDHGSMSGNVVYLNLWGEQISTADFAAEVNKVDAGHIAVTMEQCHSGGFIPDICHNNRTISTACKAEELSYAMPPDYTYDEYVFHWISAVGGTVNADTDLDGIVSLHEAFIYAEAHDTRPETPQYCSQGAINGDDIGLLGYVDNTTCGTGDDIHIYDHQTFYQNKNIPGNIIIHEGGFLEVGATLKFGEAKSIQVLRGGRLAVYDAILTKCDDSASWQGIIAEENSFLYITNSEILDAIFPVTCKNNTELYLENTKIKDFENALTFEDNVTVSSFENNEFSNGNKGIKGTNCTFLDLKADYSRNKFSNIDIGIWLSDCSADIQYNDFENVRIGIMPVLCFGSVIIKNNNIGYKQSGIVANITGGLHVEENVIGHNGQYGDNGIKIFSGKNAFVFDNEIFALKNGILSFQNNAAILNNMVDVSGYYADGVSFTGSNGYIADNLIFGTEAEAGIDAFVGTDHLIENNEVYIMNSSSFTNAGMIKLQGPTECTVKENILNADNYSDGLLLGNSGSNLLECNEVTNAKGNSLNVDYNSEFQEIKTNTLTGRTDLIIKSEIGIQRDKGNEFVGGTAIALGLSVSEVDGSIFYANPDPVYENQFPDHWSPENLLEESTKTPEICKSPQGPGNINIYDDPVRLCEYFNRLKVLQTTNPKLFMVKLMHILNYLKKHKKQVPDCIKVYVQRICGLDKISDVYVKLVGINKNDRENTLPLATIRENISADRIDAIKGSISEYKEYYQREYEGEMKLLDTLRTKLDSIRCPDTLIQVWKKVLLSYIDLISGDSVIARTELTQIAKLCCYDYGEVVNLSRMMISEYDTTNYNVYDDCREPIVIRSNKTDEKEADIYPNPTQGNLTVILPEMCENGALEIYNINGLLVQKVSVENRSRIELKLNLSDGTYLMKLNASKGELYLKKFVVIR